MCVDVEGEDPVPVRERTDGKSFASVIGNLISIPQFVSLLGLSTSTMDSLKRIEDSAYGEPGKEPEDVWQSPKVLIRALEEMRKALGKARSSPSLLDELEEVRSGSTFYRDELDDYLIGTEDAINICDWAINQNKRVRLRAW